MVPADKNSTKIEALTRPLFENWKKKKKITSVYYRTPKGKFIPSPQEKRQGPRFKVSSKGLQPKIDILTPISTLTELDNTKLDRTYSWPYRLLHANIVITTALPIEHSILFPISVENFETKQFQRNKRKILECQILKINIHVLNEWLKWLLIWIKWLLIYMYRLSSGHWPDLKAFYST